MVGLANYSADNSLNYFGGQTPMPTLPSVWMALYTAVGTDAGTGFTEVSGGSYARTQVAGTVAATASWTTGTAITMASNPGWVVPGMNVYDTTNSQQIGTVLTYVGTALTLTAGASHASSGSTDNLVFSALAGASGTAPSSATTGAAIAFPQATASWGTVIAWALYDASTSGNLLLWDFLGNYAWLPCYATSVGSGNGAVFSTHAHGYSNGDPIVVTAEYGGALPTVTQGALSAYTQNYAANVTTDTFTLSSSSSAPSSGNAVWTSTTSALLARKFTQQPIAANVTMTFSAGNITALAA